MRRLLRGSVIHQTQDALGNILVIDHGKHRILTFDSIFEQSKIDRKQPQLPIHEYNRAMLLPIAFAEPRHVTILGLGGGVLVGALHHLSPDCALHAVELRREVLGVARQFFSLPDTDNVNVTIADARRALPALPEDGTDLILTDLYDAQRMSPVQAQLRFIDQCDRALGPEGWLAINYHRLPPQNGPLFLYLRAVFAIVLLFKSKTGNYVLYASKAQFEPMHGGDPRLDTLEERLPIDWRWLMNRVVRVA
jgi:spermidine synthase